MVFAAKRYHRIISQLFAGCYKDLSKTAVHFIYYSPLNAIDILDGFEYNYIDKFGLIKSGHYNSRKGFIYE